VKICYIGRAAIRLSFRGFTKRACITSLLFYVFVCGIVKFFVEQEQR